MDLTTFLNALWWILPAYFANSSPVLVRNIKILEKYNKPIDFGKNLFGKRILGDGKTWFGLFCGVFVGSFIGLIQSIFHPSSFPEMTVLLAFLLSFGTLVGDSVGSFIKRRINLDRGRPAPLLDQLSFVPFAFAFALLVAPFNPEYFLIILLITPFIHLAVSFIGWKIKIKREWW